MFFELLTYELMNIEWYQLDNKSTDKHENHLLQSITKESDY